MRNIFPDLIICLIISVSLGLFHIISNLIRMSIDGSYESNLTISQLVEQHAKEYGWFLKLMVNCLGYSYILIPGYLIYRYTHSTKYLERTNSKFFSKAITYCFTGTHDDSSESNASGRQKDGSVPLDDKTVPQRECFLLFYCFSGLMVSYLTWGVLQEKIMTKEYENAAGEKKHFRDSQFLVFANRMLALVITAIYLVVKQQLKQNVPLFKYSFASLSNIMSAWFQYEALKFVSFPTQVLAKSCKIIPVMIMGKIISKNKYELYEYVTAVLISCGMIFFLTGSDDNAKVSSVTTLTGILLLMLYMIFDSFTSNWQGDLFKTYKMNSIQMTCGVNLFSSIFTLTSLIFQGGFMVSMDFAREHPAFMFDCVILSVSSAIGQLFIFYTISTFGPVVFTIIMTIRQAVAILLSCLIYNHNISSIGIFGIFILFLAIFLRVYCHQRIKKSRLKLDATKARLNV